MRYQTIKVTGGWIVKDTHTGEYVAREEIGTTWGAFVEAHVFTTEGDATGWITLEERFRQTLVGGQSNDGLPSVFVVTSVADDLLKCEAEREQVKTENERLREALEAIRFVITTNTLTDDDSEAYQELWDITTKALYPED